MGKPTSVNLDDEESERLKTLARKQGISVSSLMRKLAKDLIKQGRTDNLNVNLKEEKETDKYQEKTDWGFELDNEKKEDLQDIKDIKETKEGKQVPITITTTDFTASTSGTVNTDIFNTAANILKIPDKQIPENKLSDKSNNKQPNREIRRRNMPDDKEERYESRSIRIEPSDEEKFRKFMQKEKFNETFKEMHEKIKAIDDRVCKDGECTKNELKEVRKDLSDLKSIKTDLSKLDNLSKLESKLDDIVKKTPKVDVCPDCGEPSILHLSSFCSNCGTKVSQWTNDDGTPVHGWKPFWERAKTKA